MKSSELTELLTNGGTKPKEKPKPKKKKKPVAKKKKDNIDIVYTVLKNKVYVVMTDDMPVNKKLFEKVATAKTKAEAKRKVKALEKKFPEFGFEYLPK